MDQTKADALALRVWEHLSDGNWHSKTELERKFRSNRTPTPINDLLSAGVIEWRTVKTTSRNRTVYRAILTEHQMSNGRPSIHECPDDTWLEPYEASLIIGTREATVIESVKRGHLRGRQVAGGRWQIKAGDARHYAETKGQKETKEESLPNIAQIARVVEPNGTRPASPPVQPNSLREVISKARAELKIIDEQLTLLQTRKAELTEVMTAAETVNRYLTVAP